MSVDVPDWIPREPVADELKRIASLEPSERDEQLRHLCEELKSLLSVKSCDASESGVKVVPRCGLAETKIGGDFGKQIQGHVSAGYANYFQRGEAFELRAKSDTMNARTFSFVATVPILSALDVQKACSFARAAASATWDTQSVAKFNIEVGALEARYTPIGSGASYAIAGSVVRSKRDAKTPTVVAADPRWYLKLGVSCSLPMARGLGEVSCILADSKWLPLVKVQGSHRVPLGYGFSVRLGGGMIFAERAVPFPEKFRLGGPPTACGIDLDKFGTSVGGFPSGNDWWSAASLDFETLVLPQYNLNGHFFVNAAVAGNRKSNCVLDYAPSVVKLVSAGAGLTFNQGPVQVQLNTQYPYVISSGLRFLRFQIGICPL